MSDDDLIRRGDAMHIVEGWRVLEDDIEAIPAAPTFTAADLERAWRLALSDTAELAKSELSAAWAADLIAKWALALTPPADLAQRVKKGPAHD